MNRILFFLILCSFHFAVAQSVLNTSVVSMCGCPGEVWDFTVPYQPKVYFPSSNNSKRLMHTNYGFNIPSTATVTGIKATLAYNASGFVSGTLKDSVCTLLLNGNLIGDDHNYQTSWYTGTGTVSFGGPGDLWGQAVVLTPYNISSPGFGFNFKLFSAVSNATFTVLNGVEITVYYADVSGINESQTSSSDIKVTNWQDHLSFDGLDGDEELEIYDINGRRVLSASQLNGDVDVSSLQNGIYFCHIKRSNSIQIRKILVQHQ